MIATKIIIFLTFSYISNLSAAVTEEDEGVKYANPCEVCKILSVELESKLSETENIHDVFETGYALKDIKPKKKIEYHKSEIRLIEALEGICDRILKYNIHKERQDSTRFAKGMSQTFETLHGLVNKGVKVDLGIPYELWDNPSAEVTHLKTQCENALGDIEPFVEEWYYNHQDQPLKDYVCRDRYLANSDSTCLYEQFKGDRGSVAEKDKTKETKTETEVKNEL